MLIINELQSNVFRGVSVLFAESAFRRSIKLTTSSRVYIIRSLQYQSDEQGITTSIE